jgi:predicted permease
MSDLRLALRRLRKAPLFTALAVTSLGLALGANTAIFTLLDQVILRPLPVERPHELVQVRIAGSFPGNTWGDGTEISYPMYVDFRDHNQVFGGMFARFSRALVVNAGGRAERANGELVSGTYFRVLGVRAVHGRLLTPDDDRVQGGHPVAVLSHAYWQSRFAGDSGVVGRSIAIGGHPFTVVGIAQEGFNGIDVGTATQMFVPMMMKPQLMPGLNFLDDRRARFAKVFARLRPGVSAGAAQARLQPSFRAQREEEIKDPLVARASEQERQLFREATIEVVSAAHGHSGFRQGLKRPLWILMAIVGGVLLIACANVAGLLIARGTARQSEIAISLAIGGSRVRVARQLVVESVILATIGAVAGLIIATWGCGLLVTFFGDPDAAAGIAPSPDARVVAFNFALALFMGLAFGVVPALQTTKLSLAPALRDRSARVLGGGQVRLRQALVIGQVALSLVLLVGAGLFGRSLRNLLAQHPGFETTNLVHFFVDPSLNGYPPERSKQIAKALIERASSLPGVTAASLASKAILEGGSWASVMTVEGHTTPAAVHLNTVMPGYFATMRIPLLRGRDFTLRDERRTPAAAGETPYRAAVANQRFVERYFAGTNPLGRRVGFGSNPGTPTPIEIVGVVGTSKYVGIRDEAEPQLFFPLLEDRHARSLAVYVRTTHAPDAAFASLRAAVREVDADLPVLRMRTMEQQVNRSLTNDRLLAGLSAVLGVFATLLAVVGLYGVMAYTVMRRTREIGIRMALGALASRVVWSFVREAAVLIAAGFAVAVPGIGAVRWYASSLDDQLYGVTTRDANTIVAAMLMLAAVASAGALVPALRAARVNPVKALRAE